MFIAILPNGLWYGVVRDYEAPNFRLGTKCESGTKL